MTMQLELLAPAKTVKNDLLPPPSQKRLENGGVVLAWPEGGIAAPAIPVGVNRPILRGGISLCSGCGSLFQSVAGFDKHQTHDVNGRTICWEPGSIGLVRNAAGRWVTGLREYSSE